jgi:hypothetical protein
LKPYWGKPTVRNFREGAGNVGYGRTRTPLRDRKSGDRKLPTYGCARLCSTRPRQVPVGAVAAAWRPALDQVWHFLRTQPGLRTDGHNIFLYHHSTRRNDPIEVDFGVAVARSFLPAGEVYETETPAGEAAIAVHRGGTISCVPLTRRSINGPKRTTRSLRAIPGRSMATGPMIHRILKRPRCISWRRRVSSRLALFNWRPESRTEIPGLRLRAPVFYSTSVGEVWWVSVASYRDSRCMPSGPVAQ